MTRCLRRPATFLAVLWILLCAAPANAQNHLAQPSGGEWKAYLVSRSLRILPGVASHRFVAIARYPGDPQAEIYSFTKGRRGLLIRARGRLAERLDWKAWARLDKKLRIRRKLRLGVNASEIDAPVWVVRFYAQHFAETSEYRFFSVNSNTAVQAIANHAAGEYVFVHESRPFGATGSKHWEKIRFTRPILESTAAAFRTTTVETPVRFCPAGLRSSS